MVGWGGEVDVGEEFFQDDGCDVGGDGVGAEDQTGPGEDAAGTGFVEAEDFDQEVDEGEAEERDAGGDEDVGAGPELFVEGEDEAPEEAEGEADEASEGEAGGGHVGAEVVGDPGVEAGGGGSRGR